MVYSMHRTEMHSGSEIRGSENLPLMCVVS